MYNKQRNELKNRAVSIAGYLNQDTYSWDAEEHSAGIP